jgi:hypothetical protein
MKQVLMCLCLVMISCQGGQSPDAGAKEVAAPAGCDAQRQEAISDFNSGSMKYYFHGIAYPSKKVVEQLQAANVTVVMNGCMPQQQAFCYNFFVDSLLGRRDD